MAGHPADAWTRAVPFGCLLVSVSGFQVGAALAKPLFATVGAEGASTLRLSLAALMLTAIVRPWRRPLDARSRWLVIGYGLALAGLNLFFYIAILTLPLGVTVAIELLGPLSLAVLTSRRPIDLVWASIAGCGILLLLPLGDWQAPLDPTGLAFALMSACCWVVYIVLGQSLALAGVGNTAAALGVGVAALAVLPLGIAHAGTDLLRADVLPVALLIAFLSGALPYALELAALKRLPTRVFGILMSLEPAFAALFGYLMLDQHLTPLQGAAIAAVMTASAGTAVTNRTIAK